jgi:hypothetical protein
MRLEVDTSVVHAVKGSKRLKIGWHMPGTCCECFFPFPCACNANRWRAAMSVQGKDALAYWLKTGGMPFGMIWLGSFVPPESYAGHLRDQVLQCRREQVRRRSSTPPFHLLHIPNAFLSFLLALAFLCACCQAKVFTAVMIAMKAKLTSFAKLLSQLPGWFNDCFGGALPTHDALAEVGKQVGCTLLWCHNATATFAWTSGFQLVSFSHLHLAEQETDLGLGHSVSCSTFPRWRIHCAVIEHREVLYCSWLRRLMGLALFTRAPCPRRCPICKGRQARHPVARLPAQGVGK